MKRAIVLAVLGLLLSTAFAAGQATITAPAQIADHKFVDVSVVLTEGTRLKATEPWLFSPAPGEVRYAADNLSCTFVGPPATYTITVRWINVTAFDWGESVATVVVGDAVPPDPQPTPDPTPTPVPGLRQIVLVEESEERTPELAQLITSKDFREYVKSSGHSFFVVEADQPTTKELEGFKSLAKTLPMFFITDSSGTVLYKGAPPKASESKALVESTQTKRKAVK